MLNSLNSLKSRFLLTAALAVVMVAPALAQTTGGETGGTGYEVDYSASVEQFGTYLQTMIQNNVGLLFGILALIVGFWFIWRHVSRLAKSL